ncbi:hypothetical protein HDA35_001779 [Micromonospora purpureochromogenes]|uniref:Uncharacterized protein n=1 Tax=Micromonospora purpureochromogenes TaxID=47872 RepID=A0ABX2RL76_9ACTN|nr:hypothetical protein [Micromonospora purpureochromogenes]
MTLSVMPLSHKYASQSYRSLRYAPPAARHAGTRPGVATARTGTARTGTARTATASAIAARTVVGDRR